MVMERGVAASSPSETYQQMAALHPMQRMGKTEKSAPQSCGFAQKRHHVLQDTALLASVVEGHVSGGLCAACDMNSTCCDVFVTC
jgi:hypothetical protein